jgi:dsDNA-specific endonuclease/ATPase MutS2
MTTRLRFKLALAIALTNGVIANAQESVKGTSDPKDSENVIQAVDKLIEQNQQLEKQNQDVEMQNQQLQKQNQELIEQIKTLRSAVDRHVKVSEQAAGAE